MDESLPVTAKHPILGGKPRREGRGKGSYMGLNMKRVENRQIGGKVT